MRHEKVLNLWYFVMLILDVVKLPFLVLDPVKNHANFRLKQFNKIDIGLNFSKLLKFVIYHVKSMIYI